MTWEVKSAPSGMHPVRDLPVLDVLSRGSLSVMPTALEARPAPGELLRSWRHRRGLTQLELAHRSEVSTRHLSCVETGKAQPTRELLLRLSEVLEVPLRDRNAVLLARGLAPEYPEHDLGETPMAMLHDAIEHVLQAHSPFPAVVIDRAWDLVAANAGAELLMEGVAPHLLDPPVNLLRLSLHPGGLAPRILDLPQWRSHLLHRLEALEGATGDPRLGDLLDELRALPGGADPEVDPRELVVPLQVEVRGRLLNLFSLTTVFGTPLEVTVSELAIETFHPLDAATTQALHELVPSSR